MAAKNQIVERLNNVLASEYVLTLKTQNFHWNVEGPLFYSLHKLFEEHYNFLNPKIDEVAERIRALGFKAPGSFREFGKLSHLEEAPEGVVSANQMIDVLYRDHEKMVGFLKETFELASVSADSSTAGVLDALISFHEKAAWMIKSHRS